MSQANREHWNKTSERYQVAHDPQLSRAPKAWGSWSVPESEVQALGDLDGLRVLELGCGGGQWSGALADEGTAVIGLDLSERQLGAAQRFMRTRYPLVQAAAEHIPFRDGAFDVVFCDHGAMSWADPFVTVPEVARIVRPGGRLAFCETSPWVRVCYDDPSDLIGRVLVQPYFGLHRSDEGDGASTYGLPYGEWIRLFRRNGFEIEDLIELRPGEDAETTYWTIDPPDWPQRWPMESLWVVRRKP